ncbi:GNAT family N-acetyltransferase [Bacillus manliponensis]|uniref:GNAT family N-acetyltransferase n=1 Tax=Bacillus manliponensis TaxID=574376 RepID=UPI00351283B5
MPYTFQKMTEEQAKHIAYYWHYDGKYAFYNMEADEEDLAEFLNSEMRGDQYFAVMDKRELVGFFSFYQAKDNSIDMGLGMAPSLTGIGKGLSFVKAGMMFSMRKYNPKSLTLSVAAFNERAIKVYEKVGFEIVGTFVQQTNGSRFEFIKMVYTC